MHVHCIWIFLSLICVNWTRTENREKNKREREEERWVGGDGAYGCSLGELSNRQHETFQTSLYIGAKNQVLIP